MKKEVVIIILLLAGLVNAVSVSVSPSLVYGSTRTSLVFELNNLNTGSAVTVVDLNLSPLVIHSARQYSGWDLSTSRSTVAWTNGSLGTNVRSAIFEVAVDAPLVALNSSWNLSVVINNQTFALPFILANDSSGPVLSSISPGSVVRNETVQVNVTAQDNETGVSFVEYTFGACSGSMQTVNLSRSGDVFSGFVDFSSFGETSICYTFAAHNNGGEISLKNGGLALDGSAPNLTLIAPLSNVTENAEFLFRVSDNIARSIPCTVKIGSLSIDVNASNNSLVNVSLTLNNISEGAQSWSVECIDLASFSSSQQQSIVIDTSPPSISLQPVPQIKRSQTVALEAVVADSVGLSQVSAFADGSPLALYNSGSDYLANFTGVSLGIAVVNFVAVDLFNHSSNLSSSVLVIPNHDISLSLVKDGSSVSVQGSVVADGSLSNSTVLLKTPAGNFDVPLSNSSFSYVINLSDGNHALAAEYWENGAGYTAEQSVQIGEVSSSASSSVNRGERNTKTGLAVASLRASPSAPSAVSAQSPSAVSAPAPASVSPAVSAVAYSSPSLSTSPKATGVFSLGGAIAWISLFLAVALLVLLVWYSRRKPKQGLDWSGYFERRPRV